MIVVRPSRRGALPCLAALALASCQKVTVTGEDAGTDDANPTAQAASPEDCRGTLGPQAVEKVTVAGGGACVLDRTRVRGSVEVGSGGTLRAIGAIIEGDLKAEGARVVSTSAGTLVGGNVQIRRLASARVEDTAIDGDLQVDEAGASLVAISTRIAGDLQVKKAEGARIDRNTILGDVQLEKSRGPFEVSSNDVAGNLQVFENSGGVLLVENRIGGNLQCKKNDPAPTGGGNQAKKREGQCARL